MPGAAPPLAAKFAVYVNQVDQGAPGAKLKQSKALDRAFHDAAKDTLIEIDHYGNIACPDHDMIDAQYFKGNSHNFQHPILLATHGVGNPFGAVGNDVPVAGRFEVL